MSFYQKTLELKNVLTFENVETFLEPDSGLVAAEVSDVIIIDTPSLEFLGHTTQATWEIFVISYVDDQLIALKTLENLIANIKEKIDISAAKPGQLPIGSSSAKPIFTLTHTQTI